MQPSPDDPRLTAYLLGELPPDEAAEITRAAESDPVLAQTLRDLHTVQATLSRTLAPATAPTLLPHQRAAILRAARQPAAAPAPAVAPAPPVPLWHRSWFISTAAAALVLLATILFLKLPGSRPTLAKATSPAAPAAPTSYDPTFWNREVPLEIAVLPVPGPDAPPPATAAPAPAAAPPARAVARDRALANASDIYFRKVAERLKQCPVPPPDLLPVLTLRDPVPAASQPVMDLPVLAGNSSLTWIANSVRQDRKAPPAAAVRLEEILNHFQIQPQGIAQISQGVTLYGESMPCPWKPSATLFFLTLRGAADGSREVTAAFRADPAAASSYRLLGFATPKGIRSGQLPTRLPALATTTLAIEVEPVAQADRLGEIQWTVGGKPAAPIPVSRHTPAAEPSDDARFAALVCAFAQWLSHDQPQSIDAELVGALSREVASPNLPNDRRDFLSLIRETQSLAKPKP